MPNNEIVDYDSLAESFSQALIQTLRKHSIADTFLDYWVPDSDPVLGIAGMADSARLAGLGEIAIRFRTSSVPRSRFPELERAIGQFSTVALELEGDTAVVHATDMARMDVEKAPHGARLGDGKPQYWRADMAGPPSQTAAVTEADWDADQYPQFADAHPHFRPGLKAAFDRLDREGDMGPADKELCRVDGRDAGVVLTLDIDPETHIVSYARHQGATRPSERAALDLFCRMAETLPLQEVADHVGLKVIEALVDEDKTQPASGILLPFNAGAPFMVAPRLARQAYDAYRARTAAEIETNFYYDPPSAAWLALSAGERTERVVREFQAFHQSEDLRQDDMELSRLEKNKYGYDVRGVIRFNEDVKSLDKPRLMRRLEQHLRRRLEPTIELISERATDRSPLRRLG